MLKKDIKAILDAAKATGQPQAIGALTVYYESVRPMNSFNKIQPRWNKDRYITRDANGTVITDHAGAIGLCIDVLYRKLSD